MAKPNVDYLPEALEAMPENPAAAAPVASADEPFPSALIPHYEAPIADRPAPVVAAQPGVPWYRVKDKTHYINNQLKKPGDVVQYAGKPGKSLEPISDEEAAHGPLKSGDDNRPPMRLGLGSKR